MRIGLRVINQFQVNQHVFVPGKFVPDEIVTELNTNDPSQLPTGLNNGYVKWEPVPEAPSRKSRWTSTRWTRPA
jgi:hypothetical protein